MNFKELNNFSYPYKFSYRYNSSFNDDITSYKFDNDYILFKGDFKSEDTYFYVDIDYSIEDSDLFKKADKNKKSLGVLGITFYASKEKNNFKDGKMGLTGEGNTSLVFSTVREIVIQAISYILKENLAFDGVAFSSSDNTRGRSALYKRFMQELQIKYGFKNYENNYDEFIVY